MKNLNSKKQEEFSKMLELNKEDIANLSQNNMNVLRGGWVSDATNAACTCEGIPPSLTVCCQTSNPPNNNL